MSADLTVFARYGFVGYAVWYARPEASGHRQCVPQNPHNAVH